MAAKKSRLRIRRKTGEILLYGAILLIFALWQAAPRGFPTVGGGRPFPLIPLTVAIAMFVGPVGGAAAGIAAGLLWDLFAFYLFGYHALTLMILACGVGLLVRLLLRNNTLSAILLMVGAVAVQTLLDWLCFDLLPGGGDALWLLTHVALPNVLYTLVLCLPLYGLIRLATKALRRLDP